MKVDYDFLFQDTARLNHGQGRFDILKTDGSVNKLSGLDAEEAERLLKIYSQQGRMWEPETR